MTLDFFMAQMRTLALAVIAYMAGAKKFTPEEAGLMVTVVTTIGPILIPYFFSTLSNWGVIKVPVDSRAAAVSEVEKRVPPSAPLSNANVAAIITALPEPEKKP